jgi:hypothetical protein
VAVRVHLQDGEEFNIPVAQLIDYSRRLFTAKFTVQEGAGRPMTKGTGAAISNPAHHCATALPKFLCSHSGSTI